jgi:NAD(P)-dependent dehydrogenase (short-subunit alcohol dehydrogenase family)
MGIAREPGEVIVVTGVGDMGAAAARRLGAGRHLVLADWSEATLHRRAEAFRDEGHFVHEVKLNIADRDEVRALAQQAAGLGRLRAVFNTAGVSPVEATSQQIFDVDVLGTAMSSTNSCHSSRRAPSAYSSPAWPGP